MLALVPDNLAQHRLADSCWSLIAATIRAARARSSDGHLMG